MLFGLFLFLVFHCGYTLLSQFPHSRRRFHFQETFLNPVETCPLRSVVPSDIGAVAWAADTSYLFMARGFLYLVAILDWHSRYVVAWRLSNNLEADFCVDALKEALGQETAGSLQHRPGQSIHQPGIHPCTAGTLGQDQHGRERAVHRRHLRGTVVAHREVRGGVPESLPPRPVNPGENWAPASGSTTARDLIRPWATGHRPRPSTRGPVLERRGRATGLSHLAGGIRCLRRESSAAIRDGRT